MRTTRCVTTALALLLWMIGTAAQAQNRFVTEYQLDRDIVEIPFEYRQHEIVIHGEADDKKDLTMIFDTGASLPVFDPSLHLTGSHLGDSLIHEAEGQTHGEQIWVSDLRLKSPDGVASVHNMPVLITDLSQVGKVVGVKIDGIVGIAFMAGFVFEIDYGRHVLRFFRARDYTIAERKPDNQRTFLFDITPNDPKRAISCVLVKGFLHDKFDYDFLLDSGFGGYASIAQSAAQESGMLTPDTPKVVTTSYSISHTFKSTKIRAPFFMLGEINLSGKVVQIDYRNHDEEGQTGILGNRFLQNYRVTLDYPRRKLWLERATTKDEPDDTDRPSLGLSLRSNGQSISIEKVSPYSPADRSGVHSGDVIVSINEKAIRDMNTAQVANMLSYPRSPVTLTLMHGGANNSGATGDTFTLTLTPTSPYDWEPPQRGR